MDRPLDDQTTGQPDNWMTGLQDHRMTGGLDEQTTGRSIVVVHKCSICYRSNLNSGYIFSNLGQVVST